MLTPSVSPIQHKPANSIELLRFHLAHQNQQPNGIKRTWEHLKSEVLAEDAPGPKAIRT